MPRPSAVKSSFAGAPTVVRAREAVRKQAWSSAFAEFVDADRQSTLDPEDLEQLSTAGYLIGKDTESGEALARAHQGYLARGDIRRAARCAGWLSFVAQLRGDGAQASGWLSRARRLLETEGDCVEKGYLLLPVGMAAAQQRDLAAAHAAFVEGASIGQRFGDRDLASLALQGQGRVLVRRGEIAGGVALLDEAMVAVMAGEVSPIVAGGIYCSVIDACGEIFDLRRAQEWTAALEQWCSSQPDMVPYRGHCLIRRAEIMQLRGAWPDALLEARCACERLSQPVPKPAVGAAFYRKAEMHRLLGEVEEAEEAYRAAAEWERVPRPGLALLRLARGEVKAAQSEIRHVVDVVVEPGTRAEALTAQAEIAIAAEDLATSRCAADELSKIATKIGAEFLLAVASGTQGSLLLAEGDAQAAIASLRQALLSFRHLEAPYEAARVQVCLSRAYRKQGNHESAAHELQAARETFRKLGARTDLAQIDALTDTPTSSCQAGPLTQREVEVVKLVASGITNREIAKKLNISEKTVARHLNNIFNKLDLSSRAAATAYAYQHGLL
jgi:DNA-binding CsgD family transcriptional regulator